MRKVKEFARRCAAVLALVVVSPVLAAAAIAIWLEDGRPFLFRQWRVGQYGRQFQILKLRSMCAASSGALITKDGDSRITKVGRLMRKLKLDELPQLWNVARGEMNWIGPRPEVPVYVDPANEIWREVLKLKPGITDLATLVFRDEEEIVAQSQNVEKTYREQILPTKLALNVRYAHSRTLWSDWKLLVLTARYGFLARGFDPTKVSRAILGSAAESFRTSGVERVPYV